MGKGYYVGLDMGTGSVGWAVTDESYQILRRHGSNICKSIYYSLNRRQTISLILRMK